MEAGFVTFSAVSDYIAGALGFFFAAVLGVFISIKVHRPKIFHERSDSQPTDAGVLKRLAFVNQSSFLGKGVSGETAEQVTARIVFNTRSRKRELYHLTWGDEHARQIDLEQGKPEFLNLFVVKPDDRSAYYAIDGAQDLVAKFNHPHRIGTIELNDKRGYTYKFRIGIQFQNTSLKTDPDIRINLKRGLKERMNLLRQARIYFMGAIGRARL